MAGLGQVTLRKTGRTFLGKYFQINNEAIRLFAKYQPKPNSERRIETNLSAGIGGQRIDSVAKSLASKGFLRPTKPYSPPNNVLNTVQSICASCNLPAEGKYSLSNAQEKFKLLEACFKSFNHSVPNSQLYEITKIDDVIRFYETPVDTTLPLDAMKSMELPQNLHIQHDYVRFHPENDTLFGGKSAFPKSSTLVTGLKYRGKYRGHEAKRSWP